MKCIHILSIGKIKDPLILKWENSYSERIMDFRLTVHQLKSHQSHSEKWERLKSKGHSLSCLLTEYGQSLSSEQFSSKLYLWKENFSQILFLIGGASGFNPESAKKCDFLLSLSPMTYPHQLVRPLLIEQIYRAQAIHHGHPYPK